MMAAFFGNRPWPVAPLLEIVTGWYTLPLRIVSSCTEGIVTVHVGAGNIACCAVDYQHPVDEPTQRMLSPPALRRAHQWLKIPMHYILNEGLGDKLLPDWQINITCCRHVMEL